MVAVNDVPSLKVLLDKSVRTRKEKGNGRQQDKELQQSLQALYVQLHELQ